jgi:hypothetical protein
MGKRGPKPGENQGKSVFGHIPGALNTDLQDVIYTRNRTQSFIVAECVRLGLPLVKELYAPVRGSRPASIAADGNGASAHAEPDESDLAPVAGGMSAHAAGVRVNGERRRRKASTK